MGSANKGRAKRVTDNTVSIRVATIILFLVFFIVFSSPPRSASYLSGIPRNNMEQLFLTECRACAGKLITLAQPPTSKRARMFLKFTCNLEDFGFFSQHMLIAAFPLRARGTIQDVHTQATETPMSYRYIIPECVWIISSCWRKDRFPDRR